MFLVKKMAGTRNRPGPRTYASIRGRRSRTGAIVRKEQNRLFPRTKDWLVTAFPVNYFRKYVGYEFTAEPPDGGNSTTHRADARLARVLARFWSRFLGARSKRPSELRLSPFLDKINDGAGAASLLTGRGRDRPPAFAPIAARGRLSYAQPRRFGRGSSAGSNYPNSLTRWPPSGPAASRRTRGGTVRSRPRASFPGRGRGRQVYLFFQREGFLAPTSSAARSPTTTRKPPRSSIRRIFWRPRMSILEQVR